MTVQGAVPILAAKRWGRQSLVLITALGVAACQSSGDPTFIPGAALFKGAVAADDARAASVGGTILQNGGSAADAVVAMYFTAAVTWPSRAGLGGGGTCIAHSGRTLKKGERPKAWAINFLPVAQGTPVGLPGNIRGMASMQALFGKLKWGQLVGPAESLAHLGVPVSQGFARDLGMAQQKILSDSGLASIYAPGGRLLAANAPMVQPDLAVTLGRLRQLGGINFYRGDSGQVWADAMQRVGYSVPTSVLGNLQPVASEPLAFDYGPAELLAPLPPAGGSVLAAETAYLLENQRDIDGADEAETQQRMGEVAQQVAFDRARWQRADGGASIGAEALADEGRIGSIVEQGASGGPLIPARDTASIGFAAIDGEGGAAACVVTMNDLFGTGRMLPGLGFTAAAAPQGDGVNFTDLAAAVVVSRYTGAAFFAGTGAANTSAGSSLGQVMARSVVAETGVIEAQNARRAGVDAQGGIITDGNGQSLGLVNAIQCSSGVPTENGRCYPVADPRGYGTTVINDEQQ